MNVLSYIYMFFTRWDQPPQYKLQNVYHSLPHHKIPVMSTFHPHLKHCSHNKRKRGRERRKLPSQVLKYLLEGMMPSSGDQLIWTCSESSHLTCPVLALKVPCPRNPSTAGKPG